MALDFRDGKTFPRRGRQPLGEFLWLARVFDKARAKKNRTQDGYIYPCPMDRAMMRRWGISASEFTSAIEKNPEDDQILAWLSERVPPERSHAANGWLLRQTWALNRHDFQEGVPGARPPGLPWREIALGVAVAVVTSLIAWLILR
jgi:hypothetical protein